MNSLRELVKTFSKIKTLKTITVLLPVRISYLHINQNCNFEGYCATKVKNFVKFGFAKVLPTCVLLAKQLQT